jgi:hypothetical protein
MSRQLTACAELSLEAGEGWFYDDFNAAADCGACYKASRGPDPTMTPCIVGKDMTLARMATLPTF